MELCHLTCIVGVKAADGKVWIGGDSAGVSGLDLTVRADAKVFVKDGFAFGFTSSFRMGQLLRFKFTPPKRHPDTDLYAYMVTDFVDAVRACFDAGGFAERRNQAEWAGSFLVGHEGHLFNIEEDYQVGIPADGFGAVGCGEQVAKGALFASGDRSPHERVELALRAAERFSAGVRGPFITVSV